MRLLIDTHIGMWAAVDESLLNRGERALLFAQESQLWFSSVSIWEARLKWNSFHPSGDRKSKVDPKDMRQVLLAEGFVELPLTAKDAAAELTQPMAHKDPFDELLLVQAQENGMKLLTRDEKLEGHPVAIFG